MAHSSQLHDLDVAGRTAPDGQPDRVAGGYVVAVEQDRDAVDDTGARRPGRTRPGVDGAADEAEEAVMAQMLPVWRVPHTCAGPAGGRWGALMGIGQ